MKKILTQYNWKEFRQTAVTILVMTIFFTTASLAFGKEEPLTIDDFNVERPAILSNNPFYEMKSFFKKLFTKDNPVRDFNEKGAELLILSNVLEEESESFEEALVLYEEAFEALEEALAKQKIKRIAYTVTPHLRLCDHLLENLENEDMRLAVHALKKSLKDLD